jgi:acyl-CoA synthetase (AMP-forming)/AMP-acid ligase II
MMLTLKCSTVPELLTGLEACADVGARFVEPSGDAAFYSYADIIRRAQKAAAALQKAGLRKGDTVALVLPTGPEFFDALLGTQLAGGIPAALYPPFRLGRMEEYWTRLRTMLNKIGARFLITNGRIRKMLGPGVEGVPSLATVLDSNALEGGHSFTPVPTTPDDIAFLQFSSGSTSEPKAVTVTHSNLFHNLAMMRSVLGDYSDEARRQGAVCWLPLYHDMGLVGCLYLGLYFPGTVTFLRPESFIGKPALWLQTISRYRALMSPAPHFAYGLCLNKVKDSEMEGVDLSSWQVALNGAEPIDTATLQAFTARFARWGFRPEALTPVYGLAEAGLAVSFSSLNEHPAVTEFDLDIMTSSGIARAGHGRVLPSVGKPLPGLSVEIHDEESRPLESGFTGRICVRGPSITKGYYNDEGLTANLIKDGWLDTGDIGFVYNDDLYIVGRAKDLIIIRGRNYAPQEIEALLLTVEGLRPGCCVAAGIFIEGSGEELLILAERAQGAAQPSDDLAADIRRTILAGIGLNPYHIEVLEPGTLPRTSSGKLRRSEAQRQFLAGELTDAPVSGLKLMAQLAKSQVSWARFHMQKAMSSSE